MKNEKYQQSVSGITLLVRYIFYDTDTKIRRFWLSKNFCWM